MPIYSVQGPDGKTYSIEGPPGATREEVIGAIQARMAQQPRPVAQETVMAPVAPATPATQRSFGEAGTDILAAGLGGLGGLLQFPGQVVGLLPGLRPVGEFAQKPGESISEFAQSLKSEGLKAREALRSKALSEAEKDGVISQFATAITSTIKDPALITTFVAEQVPLLLGPLGAVKLTQKIGAKTIESAGAGLTGAAAEQAVKEAVKTVNKRAAVAAYGTGAAMQAADVSDDTYRDAYQKALDSGLSEQEAADRAIAAARIAGTGAGVTALLAQRLPGAQAIEKRLAGVPGTKGRVASGFGEAIGESIEEGGGQVFKNIGLRQVDPNQALLEGVGGAAGLGALGGGILGTALGKRTVEQEQRFEGQREGETDRQFAARLQREIDAGLRPPAPPPAAPTLPTDQQLFTLAAQPNGYGLLENLKQRVLQDQQFPEADRKAAADNIAKLQRKMVEEEATRAQSPRSVISQDDLKQAGIASNDPLASIANKDFVANNQVFDTINQALSGEITDDQRKKYEGLYEGLSQLRQDFYPEGQDAGVPQMVRPPTLEEVVKRDQDTVAKAMQGTMAKAMSIQDPEERLKYLSGYQARVTEMVRDNLLTPESAAAFRAELDRLREERTKKGIQRQLTPEQQRVNDMLVEINSIGQQLNRGDLKSFAEGALQRLASGPATFEPQTLNFYETKLQQARDALAAKQKPAERPAWKPDENSTLDGLIGTYEIDKAKLEFARGQASEEDKALLSQVDQALSGAMKALYDTGYTLADAKRSNAPDNVKEIVKQHSALFSGSIFFLNKLEASLKGYQRADEARTQEARQQLQARVSDVLSKPAEIEPSAPSTEVEKVTKIKGPMPRKMPVRAVEIPETRKVPKSEEAKAEEEFRKGVEKKIREARAEAGVAARGGKSLFETLKGKLNPKEVFDISPDRRVAPLKKKDGGLDLDYFVDSGLLDEFLPPHMRHYAAQFDSTESQEHIKDLIRQGIYTTFDVRMKSEQAKNAIQEMEKVLMEFNTDELNALLQEAADEQRAKERVPEEVPSVVPGAEGRVAEQRVEAPREEVATQPAAPVKKSLAAIPEARFKELERRVKQAEQRADEAEKAVEQAEEAKPEVSPEIQKKIEILKQVLRKNLNKFGLKDVELNLERGMTDEGSYEGMLIKLALDAADPLGILRHESVHALKEAGFFTDKQWATLEKMADTKWIDQYLKGQRTVYNGQEMSRYDAYMQEYGGNMAMIREEAIADAFRNFSKKRPAGLMGTLTDRMKNFFKAVRSAFNGQGFESAEDIFGKVEEGALKPTKPAEAAAERKSIRAPETEAFKRWFGDSKVVNEDKTPMVVYHGTPEDFVSFEPWSHFGTPDAANARSGLPSRIGEPNQTLPAYLSIKNPLRVPDALAAPGRLEVYWQAGEIPELGEFPGNIPSGRRRTMALIEAIEARGYDGLVYENIVEDPGNDSWVAFRPEQIKSATGNIGTFEPTSPDIRKSLRGPLGYYSALSQGIEDLKTTSAPASGWKDAIKGMVNKGAVKADEVEWSGVNDWLDTQPGKVPKEAVADYLNRGGVRINEVVLGAAPSDPELRRIFLEGPSTREEDYRLQDYFAKNPEARFNRPSLVLPGGQNYREVLLTLPLSQEPSGDVEYVSNKTGEVLFTMRAGEAPETIAARERANNATMRLQFKKKKGYQSDHFDQPNILAHVRLDDRIDSDGKKVLFVEEVQSDWAQQGRKRGFGTVTRYEYDVMNGDQRVLTFENKNQAEAYAKLRGYDVVEVPFQVDTEIPTGPFVTKTEGWVNLALKRIITIASDEGYDRVAFINGKQSADRYDLSKQVDDLRYGDGTLVALDSGSIVISKKAAPEELPDLVGKEVADRLLKAPEMGANGYRRLSGLDLKVGGEGMKTFYDTIVPTALKKLLPKVGGEKMIGVELTVGGRDTDPASGEDVMNYLGIPADQQYQYWNNLGSDGRDRAFDNYRNRNLTPTQQPGFDVTPAMREKVKQGQPLFSLRSMPTYDPDIDDRIDKVIPKRPKEGFIDGLINFFSPKTFTLLREEFINRYNELAELDKRVAAQIKAAGGAQQLADERAESAALLSDQATAVAAAAMGMHNRKGGIPYYADGVVTVDTSGDNEGIVSIFAPLASTGNPDTFRHYQFWANVNRGKRYMLNPGKTRYVERTLEPGDIERAEKRRLEYLDMGIDFRDIQARWRKYNDGLVKLGRDTGVISGRAARDFMEHGDYFPFFRQLNEEDVAGPKTFSTIAGVKPPKAAKGSEAEYADFFETVVRNTQAMVTASMKNVAAQKATAQALRINEVVRLSDNPQIKQVSADTWDVFDGDYIDTVPGATKAVAESAARARFGANVNVVESPTNPGQWNVFRPVKIGQVFASDAKDAMEEARTQHLRRPDIYVYKVLENGTPVYYRAYDLKFINAIKAMNMADLPFIGLLAAPANALRTLVTKEPGYMLVNQMRDSLSAYQTSGVKLMPIVDSARQFAASIAQETPEMEALFNGGVIGGYEYAHGVKEGAAVFEREVRKKAGVKTALEQLTTPFTSLWGALERGTQISDGATRAEVYKRVLAETGNRAEALWQAAEVLNFYRHGRSPIIRVLTAAIPFMNARIQGLDVLYRAGINPMLDKNATDAQRQRMKTFWTRGMTMFALSSMYWLLVHDDEEYKKQEQETRDNYWLIPGMGLKIAIPFEVGVIFKVLPERILQNAFGSDTGKDTLESLKRQLQSTLGFNFIPQAFLPLYETQTNFSFFTQRPIIGQGMEDVAARYQVSPGTSMFAQMLADKLRVETSEDSSEFTKALAKSLDLSPIKVDHVIKGYTGTIGQYAVEVFDAMYNLNADVPKPSKRFEQLPIIKRLALDPDARGQVTGFYDLKNSVDEVVRTSNLLERTAQTEDYTKYLMNNMNVLAQRDYVLALDKSMKEFREMKTMIQYSAMSADVKRDLILDIQRMENQLTTNIQEVRKLAAK